MPKRYDSGCWRKGYGADSGRGGSTGDGGSAKNTLGSWCRWTAAFTTGWRAGSRRLLNRHGRRRHEYDVRAVGRARNDLGGGGCAARVDRTVRCPFGAVCGLEESVQAAGDATRTVAGGRADHAIWAHVREAGDRGDRGEFGPGQGTNRADSRHAPRPLGEETAAQRDHQPRSRKRVSAERISAGTQPTIRSRGSEARRLPPARAAGCGVGSNFPVGERAGG